MFGRARFDEPAFVGTVTLIDHADEPSSPTMTEGKLVHVPVVIPKNLDKKKTSVTQRTDWRSLVQCICPEALSMNATCIVDRRQNEQVLRMANDEVSLIQPIHVRLIRTWSQAVDFLRQRPERAAFYRYYKWEACQLVKNHDEQTTQQLLALPDQYPRLFKLDRGVEDDGSPWIMTSPTRFDEILPAAPGPLYSTIASVFIQQQDAYNMPRGITKLIRDYAAEGLVEECLDLLALSVCIIVPTAGTWKLKVCFPTQCDQKGCEETADDRYVCKGCNFNRYCSPECQNAHWLAKHRRRCIAALRKNRDDG